MGSLFLCFQICGECGAALLKQVAVRGVNILAWAVNLRNDSMHFVCLEAQVEAGRALRSAAKLLYAEAANLVPEARAATLAFHSDRRDPRAQGNCTSEVLACSIADVSQRRFLILACCVMVALSKCPVCCGFVFVEANMTVA